MSKFLSAMTAPVFTFEVKGEKLHFKVWTLMTIAFLLGGLVL